MKFTRIVSAILVALMILTLFVACAQNDDTPDGYQLVACEGDKFRLYVPTQGWSPNTTGGVTSAFFSMNENSSVAVYVADDAAEMSVEEYWEKCNLTFEKELDEYSFSGKSESVVLGGQPAKKYVYSAKVTLTEYGVAETATYKFMTVLCRYEGEMYVFVYSAPEEYYDSHIQDVEGDEAGKGIIPYFKFADPYSSGKTKEYSDKVEVPEGMKLISTDERPYRFFVPESWKVNDRADISAAYFSDTDSSNVSLQFHIIDNDRIDTTVEEYFAECEKTYKNIYASYALESAEDITMDGVAAKKYTYTVVSGGVEYKQMQAIVEKGGAFYVLTYTALAENFESHINDVEKMIASFDIR